MILEKQKHAIEELKQLVDEPDDKYNPTAQNAEMKIKIAKIASSMDKTTEIMSEYFDTLESHIGKTVLLNTLLYGCMFVLCLIFFVVS